MAVRYLATIALPEGNLRIPDGIANHRMFLKWLRSGDVPDDARVGYIANSVWIDPMAERAFAHNKIKTLVARVVDGLVENLGLGVYFGDGMTFTSEDKEFTCVPDGVFASQDAIDNRRVW